MQNLIVLLDKGQQITDPIHDLQSPQDFSEGKGIKLSSLHRDMVKKRVPCFYEANRRRFGDLSADDHNRREKEFGMGQGARIHFETKE